LPAVRRRDPCYSVYRCCMRWDSAEGMKSSVEPPGVCILLPCRRMGGELGNT
jgi:hypothetical protein